MNSVEAISTLAGGPCGQLTVKVKANHQRSRSGWDDDDDIEAAG